MSEQILHSLLEVLGLHTSQEDHYSLLGGTGLTLTGNLTRNGRLFWALNDCVIVVQQANCHEEFLLQRWEFFAHARIIPAVA